MLPSTLYLTGNRYDTVPEVVTRPAGEWRVTLHDIQQPPYYLPRVLNAHEYPKLFRSNGEPKFAGMPEMVPAYITSGESGMNRLSRPWQFFCFRLLVWAKYGMYDETRLGYAQQDETVKDFNYLYGDGLAWCNGAGSGSNANYVAGTNLDKEEIKLEVLTCGGHLLKVIGRSSHAGEVYLQCEALNPLAPPPDIYFVNPLTKPWLFTRSVVARADRTVIDFRSYPMYVPFQDRGGVVEIAERKTRELYATDSFPPRATVP